MMIQAFWYMMLCRFINTDNMEELVASTVSVVPLPNCPEARGSNPAKYNCLPVYTASYPTELACHPHCCESLKSQSMCTNLPLNSNFYRLNMYLPVDEHMHLVSFHVTIGEPFLEILDLSSVVCN
jgi:hypothetical protein